MAALDARRAMQSGMGDYGDLRIYYDAARDVLSRPDAGLYQRHPGYLYPPFFIVLFGPIGLLPPLTATLVFQSLKWIALVAAARLAWRLCSPRGEDLPPIAALGSLALAGRFFQADFAYGNVNTFLICATLGALVLIRRGRPFPAGVLVGLVTGIKIMPALLILYFAYKGWWRAVSGAALGVALALLVIPAPWFGWQENLATLNAWYHHLVADFVSTGGVKSGVTNQSLTAILNRVLGSSVGIKPDTHVAIVVLPVAVRNVIRLTVAAAIAVCLARACRGRLDPLHEPVRFASQVSLVLVAMLVLSGFSWKGAFVSLLLPFSALWAVVSDGRSPAAARRWAAGALILIAGLCLFTTDIITPAGVAYVEAFGGILVIALVAAAGVWRFCFANAANVRASAPGTALPGPAYGPGACAPGSTDV